MNNGPTTDSFTAPRDDAHSLAKLLSSKEFDLCRENC